MTKVRTPRRTERPSPASNLPVRKRILSALLAAEYKDVLPKLEHVTLTLGEVVYRADQDIKQVYFPEDAVWVFIRPPPPNGVDHVCRY
jgi:hypothetical protein